MLGCLGLDAERRDVGVLADDLRKGGLEEEEQYQDCYRFSVHL